MGFFSWKTQDSNKSISNAYSIRGTFPVYMHGKDGVRFHEFDYQGYGIFDNMDFFVLLATMNGKPADRA